ncbi:MAG: hypothetical protein ACRDG3_12160, partial [Tepidiformaceae bacterium]
HSGAKRLEPFEVFRVGVLARSFERAEARAVARQVAVGPVGCGTAPQRRVVRHKGAGALALDKRWQHGTASGAEGKEINPMNNDDNDGDAIAVWFTPEVLDELVGRWNGAAVLDESGAIITLELVRLATGAVTLDAQLSEAAPAAALEHARRVLFPSLADLTTVELTLALNGFMLGARAAGSDALKRWSRELVGVLTAERAGRSAALRVIGDAMGGAQLDPDA